MGITAAALEAQQLGDFVQREPDVLGALDEAQPRRRLLSVAPHPGGGALRRGQKAAPLVIADRFHMHPGRRRQPPNGHCLHCLSLLDTVPCYGVYPRICMQPSSFEQVSAAILALFPPFSATEERVALTLYRLLAEGGPVSPAALASAAGVSTAQVESMLSRWPGVYRDDDRCIIGYGGLTIAETRHRMQIDRNTRYTWCAWDSLFIPQLLGISAHVESSCAATGEPVALTVHPDSIKVTGELPAVSFVTPDPKR